MGPAPFDAELDAPGPGVGGGHAGLHWVVDAQPWRGARWLVLSDDDRRLPATLSMLLFDSSEENKDACLTEHREALGRVTEAVASGAVEPMAASGAVDWLLFDWGDGPSPVARQRCGGDHVRPAAMPGWWCWPLRPRRGCGPASTRDCSTFRCAGPLFPAITSTTDSATHRDFVRRRDPGRAQAFDIGVCQGRPAHRPASRSIRATTRTAARRLTGWRSWQECGQRREKA